MRLLCLVSGRCVVSGSVCQRSLVLSTEASAVAARRIAAPGPIWSLTSFRISYNLCCLRLHVEDNKQSKTAARERRRGSNNETAQRSRQESGGPIDSSVGRACRVYINQQLSQMQLFYYSLSKWRCLHFCSHVTKKYVNSF